ncbi:transglutaminase-like domain-containing protein [Enterococcus rivorum]
MTMPTRINELATKLTKQEKNQYDKVKAIETYLRTTGGYRYSKIDTPYTPEDKDYVDYFLFESKIGYCDNYSSAMVILLRTLDIPSRWVKGFAPGERSYDSAAATNKYTIRNSDAHSWPEVYFEGYGWIPFEPTPSFTNPIPSGKETNKEIDSTSKDSSDTSDTSTQSSLKQSTTPSSSNKEIKSKNEPLTKLLPIFKTIGISLLVLLLTTLAFYLKRYFFLLYFKLYRLVFPKKFTESYIILLNKAEKLFYRWENEPLNQYAIRFEKEY